MQPYPKLVHHKYWQRPPLCTVPRVHRLLLGSVSKYTLCMHTHARTHARTHAHTRTRAHAHTRTRAHAHTRTRAHAHTRTRAHAHTRTRAHAHTRTRAHAHTRTRAHAHTRTHAHTHATILQLIQIMICISSVVLDGYLLRSKDIVELFVFPM